ncbi:MAG: dissimilatory-type sulfite reductase subunit beta [Gammaproteobacteria bacterium]|nr:dissimilatory-type sulfite reductase subunit beta [Gammaproteobacteria bacterium]
MSEKMAPRDQGVPDHSNLLHPGMARNYGKWDYHERVRPGVLRYVAESGESLYMVRAGSPRTMSPETIEKICDIADRFCQGFLRFSMRTNVEFMVEEAEQVEPLIEAIKSELGFPIGGTGPSISNIAHTQGWLHCNLPGTDAAGAVKALMDDLIEEFENERFPNRVKIATSCCQINCGRHADIGIIVQHHHAPRINYDNMKICDLPKVVAICPVAAIRPKVVGGTPSVEIVQEKCMYCGACHGQCPSMEIRDAETDTLSIWVGGKGANTRGGPSLMKLAVWGLPNNPPRWPEVSDAVRKILDAYKEGGKDWERVGEWIERIGWQRFFEKTGFTFTKYHIEDGPNAMWTYNRSTQVRI